MQSWIKVTATGLVLAAAVVPLVTRAIGTLAASAISARKVVPV